MTAMSSETARFVELTAGEFRSRLTESLTVYTNAMRYPRGTGAHRQPMWLAHMLREGWRNVVAIDEDGCMIGLAYGYRGLPGQWWHEQVRKGLVEAGVDPRGWLSDYFELTELHVRPSSQGSGVGEQLLRRLVHGVDRRLVLLSTPEGPTRAWHLYRRMGFVDVLRHYRFAGDPRPFGILGRPLPLNG